MKYLRIFGIMLKFLDNAKMLAIWQILDIFLFIFFCKHLKEGLKQAVAELGQTQVKLEVIDEVVVEVSC